MKELWIIVVLVCLAISERVSFIKQMKFFYTIVTKVGLAINPDKTKVMKIGKWQGGTDRIVIEEVPIEEVEDFCYLGSVMSSDSSCDKEIKTRMGKANAVFGRLEKIWKSNGCSVDTKVRLHESIVLSTLAYYTEPKHGQSQ